MPKNKTKKEKKETDQNKLKEVNVFKDNEDGLLLAYQNFTKTTAIYPPEKTLEYLALGLSSEAGEVCGKIKKYIRDKSDYETLVENIKSESGDVLWYISEMLNTFNLSFEDVIESNMKKLKSRKERGTLSGSGDVR
jgi:NTP pyrophosphatase (non-canonical NTP hydrolase)